MDSSLSTKVQPCWIRQRIYHLFTRTHLVTIGDVGELILYMCSGPRKSSNDLLGKEYPFHGTSLEVKTKTPSNVAFKVGGSQDSKTSAITGDIEVKYTDKKNGLVFTETWTTSNALKSQLELENYLAKGLKLNITTSLTPGKGQKAYLHR